MKPNESTPSLPEERKEEVQGEPAAQAERLRDALWMIGQVGCAQEWYANGWDAHAEGDLRQVWCTPLQHSTYCAKGIASAALASDKPTAGPPSPVPADARPMSAPDEKQLLGAAIAAFPDANERADAIYHRVCELSPDGRPSWPGTERIADALRAAEAAAAARQDARWREAVLAMQRAYQDSTVDCSWPLNAGRNLLGEAGAVYDDCGCTGCAPLRALLTAAGAVAERPPDPEGAGDTPAAPNRGEL